MLVSLSVVYYHYPASLAVVLHVASYSNSQFVFHLIQKPSPGSVFVPLPFAFLPCKPCSIQPPSYQHMHCHHNPVFQMPPCTNYQLHSPQPVGPAVSQSTHDVSQRHTKHFRKTERAVLTKLCSQTPTPFTEECQCQLELNEQVTKKV